MAVDDASLLAYLEVFPDEKQNKMVGFLLQALLGSTAMRSTTFE